MGVNNSDSIADLSVVLDRIIVLENKVAKLADKITSLEGGEFGDVDDALDKVADPVAALEPSEGLGEWISKGALLQKLAVVCFILVFALLLRTVTDYGYVNAMIGSLLGLGYVSILAIIGCVFYFTGRKMANVFSISGFLLLFSIVFEGYQRFGTIPVGVAYAILLTALVTSAAVGIKYGVPKLLTVSMIGVTISGLAIGFPQIVFPLSGLLFFIANVVAFVASERQVSPKLKWPVTLLTLLFMAIWGFKAYLPLERGDSVPPEAYLNWLAPVLVAFVGLYFMFYLKRYFNKERVGVYDVVIPSLNVLLFFLAGGVVIGAFWQQPWLLGLLALAFGGVHFALGWKLLAKDRPHVIGAGGSFFAGIIALTFGVPPLLGDLAWAIPVWAISAYILVKISDRWQSGFLRVSAYIYTIFALLSGLAMDIYRPDHATWPQAPLTAAAILALFGLIQFRWCRKNPPPPDSLLANLDKKDYSAVVLLLVGLAGFYLSLSMLIDLISPLIMADPANTIKCGRSIIINSGVISLLILADRRHDRELAWIAVGLAIVGCLKVFLADLFGAGGMPLVLSVLSFGLVAMVGSVVMSRWNRGGKNILV